MFVIISYCTRFVFFFFKHKTAYEMRISDWSSDVCSSDLDVVDHALQAHARAVFGRVQARDAVAHQFLDLGRHDHAAAAAIDLDVLAAVRAQQIDHVLEELRMAALIRGDAQALHRSEEHTLNSSH